MSEAYPTLLAGQRITAGLLSSMQPMVARKTSDTSRAATTTTTADPHLTFDIVANGVYIMDGWLKYDGATAADINIDWTAPSGCLGEYTSWGSGNASITATAGITLTSDTQSVRGYMIRTETNDISQSRSFACLGTGLTPLTLFLKGTVRNGSTAGTYSLDWAQLASDATSTTVYTDSWIRLQRIA